MDTFTEKSFVTAAPDEFPASNQSHSTTSNSQLMLVKTWRGIYRPVLFLYVYCTKWGEISTADHLPADCIELASAKNQGQADHLKRIIAATASHQPSGRRYVPGASELQGAHQIDDRAHKFALYAAKLYRETRSCPV